jgi:hypothetical protein
MSAGPPPYEPPHGVTRERLLGVAGVLGLLAVAVAIIVMVLGSGGDDAGAGLTTAKRTPAATPEQTSTPTPRPTPPPLSTEQRAQRDAAVQILESRGFSPVKLRSYRGDHMLRVLIGKPANGSPGGRLAFFFVGDRYIGNDGSGSSYRLSVGKQSDTRTTLRYGVFSPGDEACCPSETRSVRFLWDGERLQPLDLIPDQARRTAPVQ